MKFDILKNPKRMRVLICEEEGDEILIDVQSLVDWSILPPNFPEPQDPKEKVRLAKSVPKSKLAEVKEMAGSERTSIKFPRSQEEQSDIDNNNQMHELKKQLLNEFSDVFKKDLEKHDRIKMKPVKIETIPNAKAIRPHNAYTPIETPIHMQNAANAELSRIMQAGQLEECHHATDWCARGFFVTKPSSTVDSIKVRLVSDFRGVNKILRRPGYPMDGSSLILKRLDPNETFFATIDLSSGYHQVALDPASRDMFSIILPQGKYRYTVLPQGAASSCDIFNIITDKGIRNKKGHFKMLTTF